MTLADLGWEMTAQFRLYRILFRVRRKASQSRQPPPPRQFAAAQAARANPHTVRGGAGVIEIASCKQQVAPNSYIRLLIHIGDIGSMSFSKKGIVDRKTPKIQLPYRILIPSGMNQRIPRRPLRNLHSSPPPYSGRDGHGWRSVNRRGMTSDDWGRTKKGREPGGLVGSGSRFRPLSRALVHVTGRVWHGMPSS